MPLGTGPSARDQAGALESGRSPGSGSLERADPAIGQGGFTGEAGDGARLAPRIGAAEVGDLSGPAAAGPATGLGGVPGADYANGAQELALGLLPDSRRTAQASGPIHPSRNGPVTSWAVCTTPTGAPRELDRLLPPYETRRTTPGGSLTLLMSKSVLILDSGAHRAK